MKRTLACVLAAICAATPAFASGSTGSTSSSNGGGLGNFALGLQIGGAQNGSNFSGITARVGREKTIEGILAFDNSSLIFNGNYLVHSRSFFHQDPINSLKLYGGFGLGVWTGGGGGFWAQVPLGVDFAFAIPVEASLYLAPGIDIVPETRANFHFGLGVRYWFQ